MNILCKLGIHRPLKIGRYLFTDRVVGKMVRVAECPCGKKWMTDSDNRWFSYRIPKSTGVK